MEEKCILSSVCCDMCNPVGCEVIQAIKEKKIDSDDGIYGILNAVIDKYNNASIAASSSRLDYILEDPKRARYVMIPDTVKNGPDTKVCMYSINTSESDKSADCLKYQTYICNENECYKCDTYYKMSTNKFLYNEHTLYKKYHIIANIPYIFTELQSKLADIHTLMLKDPNAKRGIYDIYMDMNYGDVDCAKYDVYATFIGYVLNRLGIIYYNNSNTTKVIIQYALEDKFTMYPLSQPDPIKTIEVEGGEK